MIAYEFFYHRFNSDRDLGKGFLRVLCDLISSFSYDFLFLGEINYQILQLFLKSFLGKFIILSLCWTFSFHILNEIRHLAWDLGYGFDLKVAKISGIIVFFGSFLLAILFYMIGRNLI